MPTFGEYETVGDPIATAEERGHTSTVWRAVKPGANDGREYAVKCYVARRPRRSTETESLLRDRGLEFLEGIKDQKKAQTAGGRSLAPIHEFGLNDQGAWYVTDYFPRSNLKAWITKKGRVDNAGLRHVVAELVAGCLALKQSRGYSHGNLKVSNAFRAGKKGTFHQSPILLTDPYPAGPARELDAQNTELLGRAMDAEDLRAIGEILLQLVEGRLLASSEDFNWPIAPSAAWKNLGKEGERWLQLCNQLLDGNRAADVLSLESLAREFRPRVGKGKILLAAAAAGAAIFILGGGFMALKTASAKRGLKKFNADFEAAKQANSVTNLNEALAKVNAALARQPGSQEAVKLKGEIETAIEREFTAAVQSADAKVTALTPESLTAAEQFLRTAEELKRQDGRVSDLRSRIAKARLDLEAEGKRKQLVEALASYLKLGDTEAQAGTPNWLQASNYYALAATNAVLLNDGANRQLAERGLARAISAIEAQSGEERLRNEVQRLVSQAREAGRTNAWQKAVDALTDADTKSKSLTNNPISVATELAAARRSLTEWQNKEAGRKAIADLIQQGDAGVNATNWLAASNYFVQALTNAVRLPDPQLAQSAREKLQHAIRKLEELRIQRDLAAQQQKERTAYDSALKELEAGSFSQARSRAREFSSLQFAELVRRIDHEESLWKAMTNHLALARYEDIITATNLPATPLFSNIKTAAARERKVFEEADREFKAGTTAGAFRFLSSGEFISLTNKPGFSSLARDAREELLQGQKAAGLLNQTNLVEARNYLSTELRGKLNKEPFKTLTARLDALENQFKQAEAAFIELVATGKRLFGEGKFAEARDKADEALKKYPGVRDRGAAEELFKSANLKLTRAGDLTSARNALNSGQYEEVTRLAAKYSNDGEFATLASAAKAENDALKAYEENYAAGDYRFISDLQSKANLISKAQFSTLLQNAQTEAKLLTELESLQRATNWSEVSNRYNTIAATPAAGKPPFTRLKSWADGLKKAEEDRQVSQIQAWDAELEKMLVWFNVLPARATESAKDLSRLGALGNAKSAYINRANAFESLYSPSWLDQPQWRDGKTRRALLGQLKSRINSWD